MRTYISPRNSGFTPVLLRFIAANNKRSARYCDRRGLIIQTRGAFDPREALGLPSRCPPRPSTVPANLDIEAYLDHLATLGVMRPPAP